MQLPQNVQQCLTALEEAAFPTYAVGGCVRDCLLGIEPHDFDLCTAATPEQMQAVFSNHRLVLAGVKHGTVGVVFPEGVVEITTFRKEGDYADNRHPDWVEFVTDIEADLSRRDFTINAMAWSPIRGLCDPFGGQTDLQNRILRAVGQPDKRFQEDALRILRGIRFAARFHLQIDPETEAAMFRQANLMEHLARERVFSELSQFLLLADAPMLQQFAPLITQIIPELAPTVGFDQHSPYHAYDIFTHTVHVVSNVPAQLPLRWAALLHDVGKVPTFTTDETGRGHFLGHAGEGARMADKILRRLKAPTALRENVVTLIEQHMSKLEPDKKLLRRRMRVLGAPLLRQLVTFQAADMGSKGVHHSFGTVYFEELHQLLDEIVAQSDCFSLKDLAIDGQDLLNLGFVPGKPLGQCLQTLLEQVMDERLPNERSALLAAAKELIPTFQEETP